MTTRLVSDKAARLLALHEGPGFVLRNAWDAGWPGSWNTSASRPSPRRARASPGPAGSRTAGSCIPNTMLEQVARIVARAGRELLVTGTLSFLDGAMAYAEVQRRFGA